MTNIEQFIFLDTMENTYGINLKYGKDIHILIFLSTYKWRKNVSAKKVAKIVNEIFLIEYLCATARFNTEWDCSKPTECIINKIVKKLWL